MNQDTEILQELDSMGKDIYWQAVLAKDARFVGIFVYGVRSTGIYCNPTCPSRRPGREQVEFFSSCEAAEAKGFRACLRCQPRVMNASRDPRIELVLRVCHLIEEQVDFIPSLESLGKELNMSPSHLQRTFKNITGITPRQYASAHRLKQFKLRIKEGEGVTSAMYTAGYGSSSRLYERASEQLGMTPATYRRKGEGMKIDYTIVDSRLGRLLVAATARGVCAVSFGARDEELVAALVAEYPAAQISLEERPAGDWVKALLRHLDGAEPDLALPLDVQATAFQQRVWEELRRIPYGTTRSYKEVAEALGQPTASRAVARACATNPVALVTPCHRVVREGGEPAKLLEREKESVAHSSSNRS